MGEDLHTEMLTAPHLMHTVFGVREREEWR
jgi:hypothetical protein